MKRPILFIITLLFLVACKKAEIPEKSPYLHPVESPVSDPLKLDWVDFLILKGSHFSQGVDFIPVSGDTLLVEALFDSTAIYQTQNPSNQMDWNKLIGFADCSSFHHGNSARVVWRFNPTVGLELGSYCYVNGERKMQTLGVVQIGDTIRIQILAYQNQYHFYVGEYYTAEERQCAESVAGYYLYPYFGGDETAPHEIKIKVKSPIFKK